MPCDLPYKYCNPLGRVGGKQLTQLKVKKKDMLSEHMLAVEPGS